jgi:hypothetical protein
MLPREWWVYQEAGLSSTHGADVSISNATLPEAQVTIIPHAANRGCPVSFHAVERALSTSFSK